MIAFVGGVVVGAFVAFFVGILLVGVVYGDRL